MADESEQLTRLKRHRLLRRLGRRAGAQNLPKPAAALPRPASTTSAASLPGEEVATPYGAAWVNTTSFDLDVHPELAVPLRIQREAWPALASSNRVQGLDPARAAFIDTETTGLAQGVGTYTFMIGVGAFEADANQELTSHTARRFVVRQFFMRNPAEERAQLHLVEEMLGRCAGIVSFNGLGFDMPLIETRLILARIPHPLPGAPHLDLLPPARRLWSARLDSCRLGYLEKEILGIRRSDEDVPGWLIPTLYREYYQTGEGIALLSRVFYHNLVDITSMPALAGVMAGYFQSEGLEDRFKDLHPVDCASLARSYERLGWVASSENAYRLALSRVKEVSHRTELLRVLGQLLKRQGRREEAALVWQEWISTVADHDPTPFVELAKYCEWQRGELASARGWTAWALSLADDWPPQVNREEWRSELQHRLARLEKKLSGLGPPTSTGEG